ncbi:MAG: response regulator [Alphaproteobacteria bacterium]|nr:MAG: response regulator [Alphaproteobacteria bacterium]
MLSIINDIIDISKIDTNQITINSQLVDVNKLMNELFITYNKLVKPKKLKLDCSLEHPQDNIRLKTDGNRIRQVFCNLLDNAIKYSEKGGIEFGYKLAENYIAFYVKDTGIGIAEEDLEMIFKRFNQVPSKGKKINSGNGLGLSISKALVERLGGIITLDSELGSGSTFTFTLPYVNERKHSVAQSLKTNNNRTNWSNKLILIVEDDINNHAYIEELLSTTSAKIVHAWDGNEAVEQVKKYADISLVLMDIKMPIMDGYNATRVIKKIRPKLPVIAQTAFAQSKDKEYALAAGCDNYISKPAPMNDFLKLIGSYLN